MVKIHYFCHPFYQKEVPVLYRSKKDGHHYYLIELFDNTRTHLPEWMTDPIICQTCELKEDPVCSLNALNSLKMNEQRTMNQLDIFSVQTAAWTKLSREQQKKIIDQLAVILMPILKLITKSEQKNMEDQSCQEKSHQNIAKK